MADETGHVASVGVCGRVCVDGREKGEEAWIKRRWSQTTLPGDSGDFTLLVCQMESYPLLYPFRKYKARHLLFPTADEVIK